MKILMLAGAGSVGKTELMNACVRLAEVHGIRAAIHKSTTRQTYEKHGFDKEKDALAKLETNRWFQKQVMQDNIDALHESLDEASARGCQILICDRTPHDYAAYQFTVFADQMTIHEIDEKRLQADYTLQRLWADEPHTVDIYMLPFPCYWSRDTQSSDGWRHDTTGKNFLWSNTVESEVNNIKRRLENKGSYHDHITVRRLNLFAEKAKPDARAAIIFSELFADGY